MPRLAAVELCPRCREPALVAGACRECGHLDPEALERCDDELPAGAMPGSGAAVVRRRWIVGRGLLGAVVAGPLGALALGTLLLCLTRLPPGALVALTVGFALLAWIFTAMLANETVIAVRDRRLEVRHGPLPLPGLADLSIAATDLEALSIGQRAATGRRPGRFALEAHAGGATREIWASPDREEVARLLRYLREALPAPRRSGSAR